MLITSILRSSTLQGIKRIDRVKQPNRCDLHSVRGFTTDYSMIPNPNNPQPGQHLGFNVTLRCINEGEIHTVLKRKFYKEEAGDGQFLIDVLKFAQDISEQIAQQDPKATKSSTGGDIDRLIRLLEQNLSTRWRASTHAADAESEKFLEALRQRIQDLLN